jgi:hypothetical protein
MSVVYLKKTRQGGGQQKEKANGVPRNGKRFSVLSDEKYCDMRKLVRASPSDKIILRFWGLGLGSRISKVPSEIPPKFYFVIYSASFETKIYTRYYKMNYN